MHGFDKLGAWVDAVWRRFFLRFLTISNIFNPMGDPLLCSFWTTSKALNCAQCYYAIIGRHSTNQFGALYMHTGLCADNIRPNGDSNRDFKHFQNFVRAFGEHGKCLSEEEKANCGNLGECLENIRGMPISQNSHQPDVPPPPPI